MSSRGPFGAVLIKLRLKNGTLNKNRNCNVNICAQRIRSWTGLAAMKLGIVSDIHGNLAALQKALALMGRIDALLCLGDAIDRNRFSSEVVALLKAHGACIILGNHEEAFLSNADTQASQKEGADQELVAFIAGQPHRRLLTCDGKSVLMVHSTPWEPRGDYIYPHSEKLSQFAEAGADFVLYGHTHVGLVRRIGNVLVVNPGSAGEVRYTEDGPMLCCAVLDTSAGEGRLIPFPDPRSAI
jgi:putative phosphoesterase